MAKPNSNDVFAVTLHRMPQLEDMRDVREDWTGVTSAERRRRLQNRLNQRAWRKRRAQQRGKPEATQDPTACKHEIVKRCNTGSTTQVYTTLCYLEPDQAQRAIAHHQSRLQGEYLHGILNPRRLLTLPQFNAMRAMFSNSLILGFNPGALLKYDTLSPLCLLPSPDELPFPLALQSTELQRTVPHHPWIDLLPFPAMRDNILRMGDSFDDAPLCMDMVEFYLEPVEPACLIVWGEPWNPYSWEVTEGFLKKWSWAITDCWELFESTNIWRKKRGDCKLFSIPER